MGSLDKLKMVAVQPKRAASAEQQRRNKLATKLAEQLKLAEAALGGEPYARSKQQWFVALKHAHGLFALLADAEIPRLRVFGVICRVVQGPGRPESDLCHHLGNTRRRIDLSTLRVALFTKQPTPSFCFGQVELR